MIVPRDTLNSNLNIRSQAMHTNRLFVIVLIAAAVLTGYIWLRPAPAQEAETSRLAIVWTSGDPAVAERMTLMYANGAKKNAWFDEVRLVVWGPSQQLVVADKDVRAYIDRLRDNGVVVQACLACADSYGIADDLRDAGLEVKYMGKPVSDFLKDDDWKVVTF